MKGTGYTEKRRWDRESRPWLPVYVYTTPAGFQMPGVELRRGFFLYPVRR